MAEQDSTVQCCPVPWRTLLALSSTSTVWPGYTSSPSAPTAKGFTAYPSAMMTVSGVALDQQVLGGQPRNGQDAEPVRLACTKGKKKNETRRDQR